MRRVEPTEYNTNERNYYIEVLPIAYKPWNYLVIFRPTWLYQSDTYFVGDTYYVGILTTNEHLVEAVEKVNELFCEDDLRKSNGDWRPELMVPVPLTEDEIQTINWNKRQELLKDYDAIEKWNEYLHDEFSYFPTDRTLTPTKIDGIVERLTNVWILS